MSPKKSFLERMGLIEPAKPTIEVAKKATSDGEKRVLGDVKLKRQPAEPMARSTEGQPVSQNVVELEKLRKEMEMAVTDYNQKSAEIHEGRDTSFDNDLSKMRKSVVDEVYDDGVLDPTPQFHFDDEEEDDRAESRVEDKETKGVETSFHFNDASLEEQMDRLLGIQKDHSISEENKNAEQKVESSVEVKPEEVLEETVLESAPSPFNEFAAKSQVPTEPQYIASQQEEKNEQSLKSGDSEISSPAALFAEANEEVQRSEETTENSSDKDAQQMEEQLLMMNQALHQNQNSEASNERFKEEIEEQIQEKIHEQIEEKFERYKEDKNGIKEELKKELEIEWKRVLKEELRQELKKDIKEEVIQDVTQDVNQFKDEITSKVASKQEKLSLNADHTNNRDMQSDWDEELSGKTAKPDMHVQYMDDQFVEDSVENAVVEVVEADHEDEDEYVEDLMKEYQPGFTQEEEIGQQDIYVEDVQERGRSGKTMEKNRVSDEAMNRQKHEETVAPANPIQVKQEFTSTAASAFKPDLHIGEKLDLIIGQYEKNKLQSIDDIYKNSRMETDTKKTIFMADVFLKAIPANLPQDVKRETVLNILKISGIELDSLLGDAYQRIDSLNKVLEETISTSNEIFKRNEDTIHELERRIQDLNEINVNRAKFQEDQNTMVEYEIQKIINLVEFVKPKSRARLKK